ncbi:MAG: hypothetical protein QM820_12255 [Minicystis sp.]
MPIRPCSRTSAETRSCRDQTDRRGLGRRPGCYQVGSLPGDAWEEWNGRFRDDVRDFIRGRAGHDRRRSPSASAGQPDIYGHEQREAEQSVNFVTCHDGFTLNDLVSYDDKHNQANGEDNRDGSNDNRSWNYGVEGPTRRSGDRGPARSGRSATSWPTDDLPRRADDPDGGRSSAHARTATTTPTARTTT